MGDDNKRIRSSCRNLFKRDQKHDIFKIIKEYLLKIVKMKVYSRIVRIYRVLGTLQAASTGFKPSLYRQK